MRFIWKFPIKNHFEELTTPIERFLTAQMQGDTLCVWAIVDVEKEKRMFGVSVMGIGWTLNEKIESSEYLATMQDGYSFGMFSQYLSTDSKKKEAEYWDIKHFCRLL